MGEAAPCALVLSEIPAPLTDLFQQRRLVLHRLGDKVSRAGPARDHPVDGEQARFAAHTPVRSAEIFC